jgi:hypothetical protein
MWWQARAWGQSERAIRARLNWDTDKFIRNCVLAELKRNIQARIKSALAEKKSKWGRTSIKHEDLFVSATKQVIRMERGEEIRFFRSNDLLWAKLFNSSTVCPTIIETVMCNCICYYDMIVSLSLIKSSGANAAWSSRVLKSRIIDLWKILAND